MFRRIVAINMPGVILSQFGMHTMPSKQWPLTMVSTQSAMSSREGREYFMPPWPIAMPSSTPMVLKMNGTPPASRTIRLTSRPTSFKCAWPGMQSL